MTEEKVLPRLPRGYPVLRGRTFEAALKPFFSEADLRVIKFAYTQSKHGHKGQFRKGLDLDGQPIRYFEHPRAVAWILADELHIYDYELICEALLHDIVEDTWILDEYWMNRCFGERVCMDVKYLSHEDSMTDDQYFDRFLICSSWRALVAKLADRLHNLRTLNDMPLKNQRSKLTETRAKVYPLFKVTYQLTPEMYLPAAHDLTAMIEDLVNELEEELAA